MSDTKRTKQVTIEVPPAVADEARRRANNEGELEMHLLDYVLFEYEWVFPDEED